MPEFAATAAATLNLCRLYNAPIARVFDAWTRPEVLASWFGPDGYTVITSELDLRVGGAYLIALRSPDGAVIRHFGEYVAICAPESLVFTWVLDNQDCQGSADQCADTLVSIDLVAVGESTQLRLTHERLPSKAALDGHQFGWVSSLECLDRVLKQNSLPGALMNP